ncbi:MAG TPA: nuclear transport factor 2 family protein [Steroidobacteraceae bacterium]|nr:nuclear transport factor 2 family protein [Steroidobacteraceae bacterium]
MLRVRAVLLAAGLAAASIFAGCSRSATSPGVSPDLKHSWEIAFNRGDAGAVAALYAPNAELVMSGAVPVRGPSAIRAAIDVMIKAGVKVRIGSEQNVGNEDVAYVYGPYSVLDKAGGRVVETGAYLEVWRRRRGIWQIDLDVNAVGPPIAPAATTSTSGAAAH